MGMYMYRVTAELVTLSDGRKAHVAKYAYKPWRSWDGDKANAKLHFQTGCARSESMTLKSDLIITLEKEDTEGRLYANLRGLRTFLDDCTFGVADVMPCVGVVRRDGKRIVVEPKHGEPHFAHIVAYLRDRTLRKEVTHP